MIFVHFLMGCSSVNHSQILGSTNQFHAQIPDGTIYVSAILCYEFTTSSIQYHMLLQLLSSPMYMNRGKKSKMVLPYDGY
jgi:hypothetical protein